MLIQDRIQIIIKANNLSASEFANKIDVKRSNLSHVLSGRNKPSLDFLSKIISTYPSVNASWLITGETRDGEFSEKPEVKIVAKSTSKESSVGVTSEGVEKIVVFYANGSFKEYLPKQ